MSQAAAPKARRKLGGLRLKKPGHLVGGFAYGVLSSEERRRLLEAAVEDQTLFDELMNEESLRDLLDDPAARAELQEAIASSDKRGAVAADRSRSLTRSAIVAAIIVLAVVLATTILIRKGHSGGGSAGTPLAVALQEGPRLQLESLVDSNGLPGDAFTFSPRGSGGSKVVLDLAVDRQGTPPRYRIGDPIRLGLSASEDANVVLVLEGPKRVLRLFPNSGHPSARVAARQRVEIPSAGSGSFVVGGPVGDWTLRGFAFPTSVDPLDTRTVPDQLPILTTAIKHFEVTD
jgi:hypothetical protein